MSEGGVSNCWVLKSTLYGACTHNIDTFQLIQKELKKKGERKIIHIYRHLGNLKKTYLGDLQLPMFKDRMPMFECRCMPMFEHNFDGWCFNPSNVWIFIQISAFKHWSWCLNADVRMKILFKHRQSIIERVLPTNMSSMLVFYFFNSYSLNT